MREEAGPQLVPVRRDAEAEARALLDEHAGHMSKEQVQTLARTLNRHWWGTGIRNNRFLPGLSTPLVDQMVKDIDHSNQIMFELWKADVERALELADRIFKDPSYLPGSGRSFPSMLLYLRDPQRFAIWFKRLDVGLRLVSGYPGHARSAGLPAYLEYCNHSKTVRETLGIEPEEMDAFLSAMEGAAKSQKTQEKIESETPTITVEAFQFLNDLRENNDKDWFDENRKRYEEHLRDPLAEVFEYVASEYIRGLDPKLETEVKRDKVLARMNKWAPGVPYYEYLWGAFSRDKKQEDVQLFINVQPSELRFGLYMGSAPEAARQRLAANAEQALPLISDLNARYPNLNWEPVAHHGGIALDDATGFASWISGQDPEVGIHVDAEDDLIGSNQLADLIGEVMVALHPLAAIAWGDDVEVQIETEGDGESSRPEYTFEDLLSETHLPAETLEEWISLLRGVKRAALFYGPPGTGKSFVAERLGRHLAGTEGEVRTVQFHPSFSYEDFIEGLRPATSDGGMLSYEVRPGVFREFCDQARGKDGLYVFVIDEINRAELGSVLGEVMMLIEYRGKTVPLPYSQESFSIPKNVVLLATMNTADRSLALVDFALRRRFHAINMPPNRSVLESRLGNDGVTALAMFDAIQEFVNDGDFAPGHSYWMSDDTSAEALEQVWKYELKPYLSEYWFESRSRLEDLEKVVLGIIAEGV